jgi:hypothetical protein
MKTIPTMIAAMALCATSGIAWAATEIPSDYQQEMHRMAALIDILPADAGQSLVTGYAECLQVHTVDWSPCDHLMDEAAAKAGIVEPPK